MAHEGQKKGLNVFVESAVSTIGLSDPLGRSERPQR